MRIKASVSLVTCCLGGCMVALVGGCENLGDLTGGSKSSSDAEVLPAVTNTDATASTESRPAPKEVWVDDDYNSHTDGWGYDHFNTINAGVAAVAPGGNVYVQDGSYPGTGGTGSANIHLVGTGMVSMAREHTGGKSQ